MKNRPSMTARRDHLVTKVEKLDLAGAALLDDVEEGFLVGILEPLCSP